MVHHLTQLALLLIAPLFLAQTSEDSIETPEKFPVEILGDDCIEIVDPNTGNPSLAFTVDTICQGDVMDFCLSTSGCNEDIEITAVSGNLGQVIITPPTSPFDYCFSYTAPADLVGEDTFTLTVTNSENAVVTSTTSVELTYVVADPGNNTTITPPQELCSPANSTTIEAINPDPIVGGYWVVLQGGGDPIADQDINNPTLEVTNLSFGESIYMWRQDYPCQSTFDLTSITVYDGQAPIADAGDNITFCSFDNSYTMQANDPLFSATGTWEITFGNATINDINDPNAEVTGLGIGCNVFEWNISNGPCPGGETVDEIIICVYDQNTPAADAGEDIEICASGAGTNAFTTSALDLAPYVPATGLWTPISGFGVLEDSDDNVTLIENLQIGTNEFVWTVENGSCPGFPSADTLEIRVYDSNHPFPEAGSDASYCAPLDSHNLLASNAINPAVGTWEIISGTGSFSNINDPIASVTNLSIGINTYRWSIYNGPCNDDTFFDEVSIVVFDSNVEEASAGVDIVLCEEDFTEVTLEASEFSFPAAGEWTIEFPLGTNVNDVLDNVTDPNAVFSSASPGEYTLRWTVNNGPCAAADNFDEVSILIYPTNQVVADAGADLDLCTPISSFNLSGNTPLSPATGAWTLMSGSGAIQESNNPVSSVTNLGIGQNVFRWTIDNGDCGLNPNFSEVTITVFNVNTEPASAGPDQDFCTFFGGVLTADLAANTPEAPAIGQWSIISGSGSFSDLNDPNAQITDPGVGTNIYEWSIDNGACDVISNTDQIVIEVYNSGEPAADAGENIEICSNEPNAFLSANTPSNPAIGSWSVVQGSGVFTEPNNPNSEVTGFSTGTNTYRWAINNGPCAPPFTFDDVEIIVYDENVAIADAGEDLEICNNFGPVVLSATSFQAPATGQWTVISGTGNFSNTSDPNSTVSGWSVGDNVYEWSVNNGPCSGGANNDQITIIVYDINADQANAGVDQEICTPLTAATMTASLPSYPSTGYWTVEEGSGLFLDDTDPISQVTGLSIGKNRFIWTIDNGSCSPIFSQDEVSIYLFEEGMASAIAGIDQNFCEPVNSTTLAANIPSSPSTGAWTLVAGTGDINDPSDPNSLVNNLSQGINVFEWTVDAGPCEQENPSDLVSINIFSDNHPPANAGDDIEVCTPNSSVQLDGSAPVSPASGTWIQVSGPNTAAFDPDEHDAFVTNLIPGTYIFQWQIDVGPCASDPLTDQVIISVYDSNAPAADAGSDIDLCTPNNFTTLSANTPIGAAAGSWTLLSGFGSIGDVNNPFTTVTNLTVGLNEFIWTIDNGSCGTQTTSDTLTILLFDNNSPDAFAGDDQSLCSPQFTTNLTGNTPVIPASVEWSLVSGSGVVTSPNSVNTAVSGLTIGENIFSYTIFNGNCDTPISTDEISVFVFDAGAPAAFAGDDIEICSNNSSTQMNADAAVNPGVGTWSLISGDPSVNVSSFNNPEAIISNLQIGIYIFEWSLDYSTCGTQADQVVITVFDIDQEDTDAGDDIVLCLPDNTTVLGGNSVDLPAVGSWEVLQGSATFSDVNDPNAAVTNLAVGENILAWSVYNGICTPPEDLTDEVSIFVYEENLPPAFAGIDQEFCSNNGVAIDVTMTAFAAANPGEGTWIVVQGSGTFIDDHDPNTLVTNIPVGINIFEWSLDYDSCAPASSDIVTIQVYNSNEPSANAGSDQSFCTPVLSVTLDANTPSEPASGSWSQIVGTAIFDDVNDPNTEITNISSGVTILRWSIDNGPCDPSSSSDLVTIFVYDENAADAEVGQDQELCLPTNSSNLQGSLPVFPGIGTWSQIEGTSTINNNNNPNSPVSNLSQGINRFVWEVFNGPCANSITTDTLTILVFDPSSPQADAGDNQNLCSTQTITSVAASAPIEPGSGLWTQALGVPAIIANPTNPLTSIENLSIGINTFQWSIYNGPCENSISSDVVTINVYDESQLPASAGDDQDICLPVNSTNFSGNQVISPAVGQWNLVSGSGEIADINSPTSAITGLSIGENIFTWTIDNGACGPITSETMVINVFDPASDQAFTEPDFQECAPIEVLTISANNPGGAASGGWTQIEGTAVITDEDSSTTEISSLDVGIYLFVWEIDNGACGNSTDTLKVEIFDPSGLSASAGDNQSYCTPINTATLDGSALISPATGEWEIVIGNGNIIDSSNPAATIENLTVGETILSWTVDNGACGGITTDFMSIFIFDDAAPDADAGSDQEFCLPVTSSALGASDAVFPAIGNWTVIEGGADIDNINSSNTDVTNLTLGLNRFVWSVDNSPCDNGLTSDTMAVHIYPDEFGIANAGGDQSFCSPINSAIAQALEPDVPSVGTWNLTDGSGSIADVNNPNTELEQLGIGTNIFSWQVYHGPCDPELTVDLMTVSIYDENHPPAFAGEDQALCLPENSVFMEAEIPADPVVGEWSIISGGGTIATLDDPSTEIAEIPTGENVFVWTIDNGPCENPITTDTVTIRVYSEDAIPANAGLDIDICGESSVILGAAIPSSPSTGSWAVVSGPTSFSIDDITNPNTEISALVVGQYVLQWIVDNGPCSDPISSDQMIINVYDLNQSMALAGDTLRQCMPLNQFQLSASPVTFPSVGTWTNSGTGDISDINDPNAILSNTSVGEQILTWSVANGPCGDSQDDLVVQVFDPNNSSADAGPDQSICTDLITGGNQAVMSGNIPIYPSTGSWNVIFGPSPAISDINDPNAVITNIGFGETQLQWVINNGPCEGGSTADVMSIFHFDSNESDAFAGADQPFCDVPFSVNLAANPTIGNTAVGTWTVTSFPAGSSPLIIVDVNEESAPVSGFEIGVYEFTWTVDNGECGTTLDVMEVVVFDPNISNANAGMDMKICEDEFLDISSVNLEGNQVDLPVTVSWSILEGNPVISEAEINLSTAEVTYLGEIDEPLGSVVNTFMYTLNNGPCGVTTDTVTYTLIDCLTIDVPDAFSPNQDFINETWFIPNLNKYPNNEIMVFNRWGTKVYEAKDYQGDWAGISEHPATIGNELPVGTYYYVLDLGDGSAAYKGFVYLKR